MLQHKHAHEDGRLRQLEQAKTHHGGRTDNLNAPAPWVDGDSAAVAAESPSPRGASA